MIIRIDEKLKEQLKKEAKGLGLTLSAYVRMILTGHIKREN